MASERFNMRNPAVKRILQELKELQACGSRDFAATVLEDNLFEWHFAVRGPPDTEFEGGIYHGRILLPPEYPFKPPSFVMLTQNGRFETGVKICLSISSHHPEHWQPSWSMRTALTALIAFMPTPGNGAIGSMDYSKEERVDLARKARLGPPAFGNEERQKVSQELHAAMLEAEQAQERDARQDAPGAAPAGADPEAAAAPASEPAPSAAEPPAPPAQPRAPPAAPVPASAPAPHPGAAPWPPRAWPLLGAAVVSWEDMALTLLAGALAAAIAALLLRRVLIVAGIDPASPL